MPTYIQLGEMVKLGGLPARLSTRGEQVDACVVSIYNQVSCGISFSGSFC